MTEYSQQPQEPNHPWTATLALDTMSNKKTVDIRSKSTDTNNTNLHLNSSQESKTATQLYHISELKPSPSPHDNHPHLAQNGFLVQMPTHSNPPPDHVVASQPSNGTRSSLRKNDHGRSEINAQDFMRACIFVRNDNHLLSEWIAYHYTILPLRHLIVGCDENITDNPYDILSRWSNISDLTFDVWHADRYIQNITYKYHHPLHRFRRRQPHFMSKCMQHFYNTGNRGWLALVDTDEYIKLNPLDDTLNDEIYNKKKKFEPSARVLNDTDRYLTPNETLWDRIAMRKTLRERLGLEKPFNTSSVTTKQPTVLQVLEEYSSRYGTLPCHCMSRLRFGAVTDNYTDLSQTLCQPKLKDDISEALNATKLSTVRFLYHAAPEKWKHNEWAKVLVDLRRIPPGSLANVANPHQPLKECPGLYVPDLASFIHANHYVNDWSVFGGRKGDTRQRKVADWAKLAHVRDGVRCGQMHWWLNEFVEAFGLDLAKHLLAHALE